ncbi:MAG: hypothetical protein ACR2FY_04570 [Pirellulaceae bacterium]
MQGIASKYGAGLFVLAALCLVWCPTAKSQESQERAKDTQEVIATELSATIGDIVQWIKSQGDESMFIDSFRIVPPSLNSTNGNLLKLAIAEGISEKITVKRQSKYSLTGKASYVISNGVGSAEMDFTVDYKTGGKPTSKAFAARTTSSRVIDVLFGNTISHAPTDREPDRSRHAAGAAADRDTGNPAKPPYEGTKVQLLDANGKPDLALEIAVRDKGLGPYVPKEIMLGNGDSLGTSTPWVRISKGQEYEIRIYNYDETYDVFAEILVDGVNVNYFYNDDQGKAFRPQQRVSHWLVHRASSSQTPNSVRISGWQRNKAEANRFEIKDFPESAAAEINLEESDAIGTITVIYRKAWKPGEKVAQRDATARGDLFENPVDVTTRETGKVRGQVCIRYSAEP